MLIISSATDVRLLHLVLPYALCYESFWMPSIPVPVLTRSINLYQEGWREAYAQHSWRGLPISSASSGWGDARAWLRLHSAPSTHDLSHAESHLIGTQQTRNPLLAVIFSRSLWHLGTAGESELPLKWSTPCPLAQCCLNSFQAWMYSTASIRVIFSRGN